MEIVKDVTENFFELGDGSIGSEAVHDYNCGVSFIEGLGCQFVKIQMEEFGVYFYVLFVVFVVQQR